MTHIAGKKMAFRFSQLLHECIFDGLKSILGESGMKVVLFNMELHRYAEHPGELHKNLYAIFGNGAFALEKVIVKELFRRLNMPYEEASDFDFARCVNQARELFKTRWQRLREIE